MSVVDDMFLVGLELHVSSVCIFSVETEGVDSTRTQAEDMFKIASTYISSHDCSERVYPECASSTDTVNE